jgi:hypothetical protein
MPTAQLTSEELIQALCRSQLPTIVVEGRDDMIVYRWLEINDCLKRVDVIQCGGRDTLLEVYRNRKKFNHIPYIFIADRDMWLFSTTPKQYEDVVFTAGYSIENDLLHGCDLVSKLFSDSESTEFHLLEDALANWFAFEVEQYLQGEDYNVEIHPNRLVPLGRSSLDKTAVSPRSFIDPNIELVRRIKKDFHLLFRGKSLVSIYTRILSSRNRASKFSAKNILEISAKCDSTTHTKRLIRAVRKRMQP